MSSNRASKTTIAHCAAHAVSECFKPLNIRWGIYGDLVKDLLCSSRTSRTRDSLQLNVHIMGNSATLVHAIQRLASVDRRFTLTTRLTTRVAPGTVHMSYNGSLMRKHRCNIIFVCGPLYRTFIIKDLPLLPIQVILYQLLKSGPGQMDDVIAISKAYLRLPNLPPTMWDLTHAEQSLLLERFAEVKAVSFSAARLLARLYPPLPVGFSSILAPRRRQQARTSGSLPPVQVPDINARGGVVFRAAEHATRLLQELGYTCAIFGSAACFLFGNRRLPNDVDILVSTDEDPEVVKRSLVIKNPLHFYLVRAKTPGATYKVLWYRHCQTIGRRVFTRQTKVDIVVAGTMMLPSLSLQSIIIKGTFPVVPLGVLLLHKLQALFDHMTAPELHKQRKGPVDVADIQCILKIAVRSQIGTERLWALVALDFFEEEFQELTIDRVKLFCSAFAECRDDWSQLGFEVDVDDDDDE